MKYLNSVCFLAASFFAFHANAYAGADKASYWCNVCQAKHVAFPEDEKEREEIMKDKAAFDETRAMHSKHAWVHSSVNVSLWDRFVKENFLWFGYICEEMSKELLTLMFAWVKSPSSLKEQAIDDCVQQCIDEKWAEMKLRREKSRASGEFLEKSDAEVETLCKQEILKFAAEYKAIAKKMNGDEQKLKAILHKIDAWWHLFQMLSMDFAFKFSSKQTQQ